MPFVCTICEEESTQICVWCTKDTCANHLCEKCGRCSDCCECDVPLTEPSHDSQMLGGAGIQPANSLLAEPELESPAEPELDRAPAPGPDVLAAPGGAGIQPANSLLPAPQPDAIAAPEPSAPAEPEPHPLPAPSPENSEQEPEY